MSAHNTPSTASTSTQTPPATLNTPPAEGTSSGGNKYSCVACKKRKIKCDRVLPACSACTLAGSECIPGTRAPYPQRRRKRQASEGSADQDHATRPRLPDESTEEGRPVRRLLNERPESRGEDGKESTLIFGQNLWTGLQDFRDPRGNKRPDTEYEEEDGEDLDSGVPGNFPDPSGILFASTSSPESAIVTSMFPSPVQSFILWQKFLQNINPLSKIVHAPSLQEQIVNASKDFQRTPRAMAVLLFAVYTAAVASMGEEECVNELDETREILLNRYVMATQLALVRVGFMKSTNMLVLQAFVIYLLAIRRICDPQTFWLLTGIAVRMGQRLKMHLDPEPGRYSIFETQMRRRIWWQIIFIDGRASQLAGTNIPPTGSDPQDYPLPANLNDADLSPSMQEMPLVHTGATEMIFCLARYEVGRFIHSSMRRLRSPKVSLREKDQILDDFQRQSQINYGQYVDTAIPLHKIAMGGIQSATCKMRLMAHHPSQYPDKGESLPPEERELIFQLAITMVENDLMGFTVQSISNFAWHMDVYFQLDALVFMLIESRNQPPSPLLDKAWALVEKMYQYRTALAEEDSSNELYQSVQELTLRAWDACEMRRAKMGLDSKPVPAIVSELRNRLSRRMQGSRNDESPSTSHSNFDGQGNSSNENNNKINNNNSTNQFANVDELQAYANSPVSATGGGVSHEPILPSQLSMAGADFQDPVFDDSFTNFNWNWDYWTELLQNNHLYYLEASHANRVPHVVPQPGMMMPWQTGPGPGGLN